jgi:hypothetical protein
MKCYSSHIPVDRARDVASFYNRSVTNGAMMSAVTISQLINNGAQLLVVRDNKCITSISLVETYGSSLVDGPFTLTRLSLDELKALSPSQSRRGCMPATAKRSKYIVYQHPPSNDVATRRARKHNVILYCVDTAVDTVVIPPSTYKWVLADGRRSIYNLLEVGRCVATICLIVCPRRVHDDGKVISTCTIKSLSTVLPSSGKTSSIILHSIRSLAVDIGVSKILIPRSDTLTIESCSMFSLPVLLAAGYCVLHRSTIECADTVQWLLI